MQAVHEQAAEAARAPSHTRTPAKADRVVPNSLRRAFEYTKMLLPCCMCHTRVSTRRAEHAVSMQSSQFIGAMDNTFGRFGERAPQEPRY